MTKKRRGVLRKKTWFPFVEDLERFYEGFMKVAFELGLEGYHAIYGPNRNNSTSREEFNWVNLQQWKCKMQ